jgi:hypothetical protein
MGHDFQAANYRPRLTRVSAYRVPASHRLGRGKHSQSGGEKGMQLYIRTEKDKVVVLAEVTKIEAEDVVVPDEDSVTESYSRTIRFTGYNGEAIEVFCNAVEEKHLWLNRVKELTPVAKPKEGDWLNPTVSTGNPGEGTEQGSE